MSFAEFRKSLNTNHSQVAAPVATLRGTNWEAAYEKHGHQTKLSNKIFRNRKFLFGTLNLKYSIGNDNNVYLEYESLNRNINAIMEKISNLVNEKQYQDAIDCIKETIAAQQRYCSKAITNGKLYNGSRNCETLAKTINSNLELISAKMDKKHSEAAGYLF